MFPNIQVIPLQEPEDIQSAGADLDSINMGKLHKVDILIMLGAITGNDTEIKLWSGATAGTKTTAMAFKYRKSNADVPAASADVFGARTAAVAGTGLVFTDAGDYNLRTVWIEFFSDQMTDGEEWLTVAIDDGSASALFLSAVAIGWPRYSGDTHTTAL